ncbi:hypothetical protein [Mesobacillus sp. S13]|uniref:DUF7662 domain-containing protein n=1 Tax=Mesobacillus sp. S13 TaxID=2880221 RepID=UPI001CF47E63|nr:hypothetical protein [Mesobacillus sp. S13]
MYNGKYLPIYNYLCSIKKKETTLSFKEIEELLGFPLPKSAYIHNAWWANDIGNHTQAKSWLMAGWKTKNVDLRKTVTFIKGEAKV